jgi:hypothetical protein
MKNKMPSLKWRKNEANKGELLKANQMKNEK